MSGDSIFLAKRNVSRETLDRLRAYDSLLSKWNPRINLVSPATLALTWERHFLDSAQVFDRLPDGVRTLADFGSGGGFPGLVIAVMAAEERPELEVTLVESDQRKAAFLMAAAANTGVRVRVLAERIEKLAPLRADVITARALAPLRTLLGYADRHSVPDGVALFQKGAGHEAEIKEALESWRFSLQKTESRTDADAVILTIRGISRV